MKLLVKIVSLGFRLSISGYHLFVLIVGFLMTQIHGAKSSKILILKMQILKIRGDKMRALFKYKVKGKDKVSDRAKEICPSTRPSEPNYDPKVIDGQRKK